MGINGESNDLENRKRASKKKVKTSASDTPTEDGLKSKKLTKVAGTSQKACNKTCKPTEQKINVAEEKNKRRKGSKINKKKPNLAIVPRKIIHDPKLIGALPALPLFYQEIVVPVRDRHQYNDITKSVGWDSSELLANPSILVIGSSNAGKSSLINFLLREKIGYESHCDVVRDYKSSFTHITYDESPALLRGCDAVSAKSWQFSEITKFNKLKNDCQIQLLQIKNPLLQEITLIDSPPVSDFMMSFMTQETTGYFPILNNLIRKVDLIIFVTTLQITTSLTNKIIPMLNPYMNKTIFCLNKSDQLKNYTSFAEQRKIFTDFILNSISGKEPKIICTSFKENFINSKVKDYVNSDMEGLILRIKKFPTQYKLARLSSLHIHMLECLYIAFTQNELRKKDKKNTNKGLSSDDIVNINKCFIDIPNCDNFLKDFSTLPEEVVAVSDTIKPKNTKNTDIDALKSFLINDFPYIQTVASEEAEKLIKFKLPLTASCRDQDFSKKEGKKSFERN